jgi:hypothetical protein
VQYARNGLIQQAPKSTLGDETEILDAVAVDTPDAREEAPPDPQS